jgi:hypothetical protein
LPSCTILVVEPRVAPGAARVADLMAPPISLTPGGVGTVAVVVSLVSLFASTTAGLWAQLLGQIRAVFLGLVLTAISLMLVGMLPRTL